MLTLPSSVRVFIGIEPADMRGSFNALAGHVRRLGRDPLDGHLYVFLNRRRTLVKILAFDRSGFCIFSKRLARGSFQLPRVSPGERQARIDPAELAMLLEGVDLNAPRRKRYRHPEAPGS